MRKSLALAISSMLLCASLFAQDRHGRSDEEFLKMLAAMSSHATPSLATVPTGTTVTVNLTAKSFSFTPSTITVNQGDTLVINLSVPANDPASTHGLLMDTYVVPGVNVDRGSTKQITINATQDGTFAFGCNVPSCGNGHSNMIGTLVVKKVSNPAPAIAAIAPASGPLSGGTSVAITGSNFATTAQVTFGGVAAGSVSVTSSASIVAVTPPATTPGAVPLVVANGDGQSGTFSGFTYLVPVPAVANVNPATGPTSGGTLITISGNGFQKGAAVMVGGLNAGEVNVVDGATITALTPLGPATEQPNPTMDVTVINPDGTRIVKSAAFAYFRPPLSVVQIFPAAGLPSGGADVTITGIGFTTALNPSLTFGGVAATNVRVLDAVTLQATVPAHAAGAVDVVLTIGEAATLKNGYSYGTPPPRKRAARH